MKVIKGTVIKDIQNERDLGDYLDAGWKIYKQPKEIKEQPRLATKLFEEKE